MHKFDLNQLKFIEFIFNVFENDGLVDGPSDVLSAMFTQFTHALTLLHDNNMRFLDFLLILRFCCRMEKKRNAKLPYEWNAVSVALYLNKQNAQLTE